MYVLNGELVDKDAPGNIMYVWEKLTTYQSTYCI